MSDLDNIPSKSDKASAWFPKKDYSDIKNLFLTLLPYPEGADENMQRIETLLKIFLAKDISTEERLEHLNIACGIAAAFDKHNSIGFFQEALSLAYDLRDSYQYNYVYAESSLKKAGISIIRTHANKVSNKKGIPTLVKTDRKKVVDTRLDKDASKHWERALGNLECLTEEKTIKLPIKERLYAIDILFICIQHFHNFGHENHHQTNIEYAKRNGASIWKMLSAGLSQEDLEDYALRDFDHCYGESAFAQVMHTAHAITENTQELKKSTYFTEKLDIPNINDLSDIEELTGDSFEETEKPYCIPIEPATNLHCIVTDVIPPANDNGDREIIKRYSKLKEPLPVKKLPALEYIIEIKERLGSEFSWAQEAVDALCDVLEMRSLYASATTHFPPMLLLGEPGLGKTRFARRAAELLGIPFHYLDMGSMTDVRMLAGTSRGWASGQPSPLLEIPLKTGLASTLVLGDEVDKCLNNPSGNGGSPLAAILALLEPSTARHITDTFLQTTCDLSSYMFILTANSINDIPKSLLSRVRPILFNKPTPDQIRNCAPFVAREVLCEMGGDPELFAEACDIDPNQVPEGIQNLRELKAYIEYQLMNWARKYRAPKALH